MAAKITSGDLKNHAAETINLRTLEDSYMKVLPAQVTIDHSCKHLTTIFIRVGPVRSTL